jgi:hypothetical protein
MLLGAGVVLRQIVQSTGKEEAHGKHDGISRARKADNYEIALDVLFCFNSSAFSAGI